MADFTITKVRNAGEKDNPHGGTLVKWYIGLKDAPSGVEDVYCQKKPGNDLSPGMEISGRLEKGEYGWRLFPEPQQGGNFKAPQSLRDGPAREERPDPQAERSRRIERQHSQHMALLALGPWTEALTGASYRGMVKEWTDWFAEDLDADVGSSQVAHGASDNHPSVDRDAADLSAERSTDADASGGTGPQTAPSGPRGAEPGATSDSSSVEPAGVSAEASRSQKGKLTQMFHTAGLSRDAMKAVVMFRCGQEKATKQGASQLITDLQEGATHDALLAEIWDAKRAGNPLGARAAALIPSEVPWEDDGSLPEAPAKDESEKEIPF